METVADSRFVAEHLEVVEVESTNVWHDNSCAVLMNARNQRLKPPRQRLTVTVQEHNDIKLGLLCTYEERARRKDCQGLTGPSLVAEAVWQ